MKITITVATKAQSFPFGTVEGRFIYSLQRVVGEGTEVVAAQESDETSVVFDVALEAGEYVASVVKNTIPATAPFTVTPSDVTFQVPATITVAM